MRGEVCIGLASFLSFAATLLLIFAHIGSTNHNAVARDISLVNVNVSGFGLALSTATGDPTPNFYNNTPYSPLSEGLGLRQVYRWGFYGYCGYVDPATGQGVCTAEGNGSFAYPFKPMAAILAEIPPQYRTTAQFLVPPSKFRSSSYEASTSRAGFIMVFIGSVTTAVTFLAGLIRHNWTFTVALAMSAISSLMLLIGGSVLTALVNQTQSINKYQVYEVPLGIKVTFGPALWLIWSAFAADLVSVIPYFLSWYSYRMRNPWRGARR